MAAWSCCGEYNEHAPGCSEADAMMIDEENKNLRIEIDKWKSLAGELLQALDNCAEDANTRAYDTIIAKAREAGL